MDGVKTNSMAYRSIHFCFSKVEESSRPDPETNDAMSTILRPSSCCMNNGYWLSIYNNPTMPNDEDRYTIYTHLM
ncbi:hypothetical protein OUZ56_015277 [Daphnia magna]|uniref:Uncharacterized protein n=1 Tax=Daphnia magna TaxID=35525 RepID=A0ABR0AMC5_9CRUS|nr:hypothetical protein OUZ56_015277 [Daphnia magna]